MRWLWAVPALGALYGLHRLALWMEARGWIYYRKAGSGGTLGRIVMDLETHLHPQIEHVRMAREALREGHSEDGEPGDDPVVKKRPQAPAKLEP